MCDIERLESNPWILMMIVRLRNDHILNCAAYLQGLFQKERVPSCSWRRSSAYTGLIVLSVTLVSPLKKPPRLLISLLLLFSFFLVFSKKRRQHSFLPSNNFISNLTYYFKPLLVEFRLASVNTIVYICAWKPQILIQERKTDYMYVGYHSFLPQERLERFHQPNPISISVINPTSSMLIHCRFVRFTLL